MRSRTNLNSKCVGCYANVLHSLYLAAAQSEELHLEGRRQRFQPAGEQSRYEVSSRTHTNVRREHAGVPNVLYAACAPERGRSGSHAWIGVAFRAAWRFWSGWDDNDVYEAPNQQIRFPQCGSGGPPHGIVPECERSGLQFGPRMLGWERKRRRRGGGRSCTDTCSRPMVLNLKDRGGSPPPAGGVVPSRPRSEPLLFARRRPRKKKKKQRKKHQKEWGGNR